MVFQTFVYKKGGEWGRVVPYRNRLFHYIIIWTLFAGFCFLFYKLIEAYLILNVLHTKSLDSLNMLVDGVFSILFACIITGLLRFRLLKHEIVDASARRYKWLWFWQSMDFIVGVILIYMSVNASFL